MPEGDIIHRAAQRIGEALVGSPILAIEAPQPRHEHDRWAERLGGRSVRAVDAHGKHLFVRFEGGLTLHSHLRMGGSWGVYRQGQRWRRSARRAWLVIRTPQHEVVQFDGPLLELLADSRTRFDRGLAAIGPDVLAGELDEGAILRRLREDDQSRELGDALIDQRNVAGIGNIWKSEGCFSAGVDPWRRLAAVHDDEALGVVRAARELMRASADVRPRADQRKIYRRAGRPCPRCGTIVRSRGQGDDNRTTYWCPGCQT